MSECLSCGEHAAYSFRLLEVQTLHIRDFSGERRVQALGRYQDYAVCAACAEKWLQQAETPGRDLVKKLVPFAVVLIFGALMAYFFRNDVPALWICGLAGVICGAAGLGNTLILFTRRRKELLSVDREEAMRRAAWACLLENAPHKDGDNDLTYIPVDEKTLAMKNGDLMIAYNLLPDIAIKAWNMLHGVEDRKPESAAAKAS